MEQSIVGGMQYPDVTLFMQSVAGDYELFRIHCLRCGLPIAQINNHVVTYVDNPGPGLKDGLCIRIQCKRCRTGYRLYV